MNAFLPLQTKRYIIKTWQEALRSLSIWQTCSGSMWLVFEWHISFPVKMEMWLHISLDSTTEKIFQEDVNIFPLTVYWHWLFLVKKTWRCIWRPPYLLCSYFVFLSQQFNSAVFRLFLRMTHWAGAKIAKVHHQGFLTIGNAYRHAGGGERSHARIALLITDPPKKPTSHLPSIQRAPMCFGTLVENCCSNSQWET